MTFPSLNLRPNLVLVVVALATSLPSLAAIGQTQSADIEALVSDLASSSFQTRELASERLQKLGFEYVPQLTLLSEEVTDLEARDRLTQAIESIRSERFATLSKRFLRGGDAEEFRDLSCWEYVSSQLGSARTSKILFLEMLSAQPKLCQLLKNVSDAEAGGDSQGDLLEPLRLELVEQSVRIAERRVGMGQRPKIGEIVAILAATTILPGQAPVEVSELLEQSAHVIPVSQYLTRRGYQDHLSKLYDDWLPKSHESMAERAIALSMRMGLSNGAIIARKRLGARFDVRQRQQAIQCVARFGDRGDLIPLSELLDDKTVCREFPSLPLFGRFDERDETPPLVVPAADMRPVFRNRICDMALAAMMLIADEDITEVFPRFQVNGNPYFDYETAVQVDDESLKQRDELIQTYKTKILESLQQAAPVSGAT